MRLFLDVCKEVTKNLAMGSSLARSWRLKRPRASHPLSYRDEELERFAFYQTRALLPLVGSLQGKHLLEIGPGDTLVSGLAFLAAGAASYTAVDRFPGDYQGPVAKSWYREVQQAWPRVFPELPWPADLQAEQFPEGYPDRVQWWPIPVEEVRTERRFDVICSFLVAELVSDIQGFAALNARLLAPGGLAVHRIDLGPHGCWDTYPDPLTFLRFLDWLWDLMGSNRGTPNRRRHHEYQAAFEAAGLQVEVPELERVPPDRVQFDRLARRFRDMPPASVRVKTAVYVCRLAPTPSSAADSSNRSPGSLPVCGLI
ncbi:MAG: methyltransferase domain-containing protein [Planctomycetes bacterium]|nr:methyltransferase domain-containing protein [Planctomycetota bacterium]